MKKIYFMLIISLSYIISIAQTPEQQINDRMTYVFAQLNLNNVPTGILSIHDSYREGYNPSNWKTIMEYLLIVSIRKNQIIISHKQNHKCNF